MAELQEATFQIQALTPIWTGNVNQQCATRILETGILGSLRWWLEAYARARGYVVPDPTVDLPQYDPQRPNDLDRVSRIFGATGWRRRFRLKVSGGQLNKEIIHKFSIPAPKHKRGYDRDVTNSEWFYGKPFLDNQNRPKRLTQAWTGEIKLHVQQTAPWDGYDGMSLGLMEGLLRLIARYGTLGAKPQLGLGVIGFAARPLFHDSASKLGQWLPFGSAAGDDTLPSLNRFVFGHRLLATGAWDQTFQLKARLRDRFRVDGVPETFRHSLLGEAGDQPERSHVCISHPYPYKNPDPRGKQFLQRFWAWLPANLDAQYRGTYAVLNDFADDLVTEIQNFFGDKATAFHIATQPAGTVWGF